MKQSRGTLAQKEGRCNKKGTTIPDNHQGILLGTRNHRHGNPFPKPKRTWKQPLLFDKRIYNPLPKGKEILPQIMLTPQMKAFHRVRLRYPSGGQHFHQVQKQVHQIYSRSHLQGPKKQERLSNQMPYVLPSTQDGVMQDCHP